ncbi:phosphoglycerate mutase-like protein [Exidia glandulosa HHB12029]|uniref:Phosphoglycerate mutase-like protein n=1 Tax=Exidia glandulosa HHB12029 TaxID=1314781 RepID=A0A165D7D3_EXIGL|nr:phosphoglycerate mutase-like protein [Exidia glandulosa HHB12029]
MAHEGSMAFPDGSTSDTTIVHKYRYTLVKGVFAQDEDDFLPSANQIQPKLGLLDDAGRWPNVRSLNDVAPEGVSYKLIIAGRHGQGFHNVAIQKYGQPAIPGRDRQDNVAIYKYGKEWSTKWGVIGGDNDITWGPDPLLTSVGINQVKTAHEAWNLYAPPTPDVLYCSPLRRALRTCAITLPGRRVKVLEDIREILTGWTCDVRSTIDATIRNEFPDFDFSSYGSSESDPCVDLRTETAAEVAERARRVLDYIFDTEEDAQVVSITAHSDWIWALFDTVGRRRYNLSTGGITPLLVRAEKL